MFSLMFTRRTPSAVANGAVSDRAVDDDRAAAAACSSAVGRMTGADRASDVVSAYIGKHEPCSASEIAQALSIPRSTLTYRLRRLVDDGIVERIGETRSRN